MTLAPFFRGAQSLLRSRLGRVTLQALPLAERPARRQFAPAGQLGQRLGVAGGPRGRGQFGYEPAAIEHADPLARPRSM